MTKEILNYLVDKFREEMPEFRIVMILHDEQIDDSLLKNKLPCLFISDLGEDTTESPFANHNRIVYQIKFRFVVANIRKNQSKIADQKTNIYTMTEKIRDILASDKKLGGIISGLGGLGGVETLGEFPELPQGFFGRDMLINYFEDWNDYGPKNDQLTRTPMSSGVKYYETED